MLHGIRVHAAGNKCARGRGGRNAGGPHFGTGGGRTGLPQREHTARTREKHAGWRPDRPREVFLRQGNVHRVAHQGRAARHRQHGRIQPRTTRARAPRAHTKRPRAAHQGPGGVPAADADVQKWRWDHEEHAGLAVGRREKPSSRARAGAVRRSRNLHRHAQERRAKSSRAKIPLLQTSTKERSEAPRSEESHEREEGTGAVFL
mmetsp:Transcript_1989/g.4606  ORF Transcript_1989/g.4606 Transcript_1989/m.4606 type:complete len:204 (+) Transcript_1989:811-1422(+)